MLSSYGSISKTNSGIIVKQTIGQQSVIGNYRTDNLIVGQGFQQSNLMKTKNSPPISITTTTYPNPFTDKINFHFSSSIEGTFKISLFDVVGRLVYYNEKTSRDNTLTIDDLFFAEGQYFVKLTSKNFIYSTNILKSK